MKKIFPKLFKISTKGKPMEWSVEVIGQDSVSPAQILVSTGQVGGAIQTFKTEVTSGKNIGRKNQTTPFQQAEKEALSSWTKARKEGYVESLQNYRPIRKPMAAHTFSDHISKVVWPAIVQPKLEGVHCKVYRGLDDEIYYESRGGNFFKHLEYLTPYFKKLLKHPEEEVGVELYSHDNADLLYATYGHRDYWKEPLSRTHFEDIVSLVKGEKEENLRRLLLKAYIFDYPSHGGPIQDRLEAIREKSVAAFGSDLFSDVPIRVIPYFLCLHKEHFNQLHEGFKRQGFEGSMYRKIGSLYQYDTRSYDLLKHKDFIDKEFRIKEVFEGSGKFSGMAVFSCEAEEGCDSTFEVVMSATSQEKMLQLQNKCSYIGKMLTVRYQRLTKRGMPYLPVGISIRDYE